MDTAVVKLAPADAAGLVGGETTEGVTGVVALVTAVVSPLAPRKRFDLSFSI